MTVGILRLCFLFSAFLPLNVKFAEGSNIRAPPGLRGGVDAKEEDDSIECVVKIRASYPNTPGLGETAPPDEAKETLVCLLDGDNEGSALDVVGLEEASIEEVRAAIADGEEHSFRFRGARRDTSRGGIKELRVPREIHGRSQAVESSKTASRNQLAGGGRPGGRRLVIRHVGNSSVLVVRVSGPDCEYGYSTDAIRDAVFGSETDEVNLFDQTDACSYGKLRYIMPENDPSKPDLVNGVVNVLLDENLSGQSSGNVVGLASAAAETLAGPLNTYDHVMYMIPSCVDFGSAAAWAYMWGRTSAYDGGYGAMTWVQMHEIGHNLGMGHSGQDGASYGDSSGYMGAGALGAEPKMCYNAAKSWAINWYEEYHGLFDPFESTGLWEGDLVGLADYPEATASDFVILRIRTHEPDSLFLTYNRKEGINEGTREAGDAVTVVRGNGLGYSELEAIMEPGGSYITSIIEGSGMFLSIKVFGKTYGTPDRAQVSVSLIDGSMNSGDLTNGLVGYYPFDGTLTDSSDRGHHAAVGGGNPTFVGGVLGQSLSLDGIDDFVSLPQHSDFDFGAGDFTLTFWYRVSGDQTNRPVVIGNKDWSGNVDAALGWMVNANLWGGNGDDLGVNLADGNAYATTDVMDVDFNKWHFVVVRVQHGSDVKVCRSPYGSFLQCLEDSVSAVTGALDSGLPINIGQDGTGSYSDFTLMDMDDLGIWRRALSDDEIDSIFHAALNGHSILEASNPPTVGPIPDPIALYEMEGNADDVSTNKIHGIIEGSPNFEVDTDGTFLSLENGEEQDSKQSVSIGQPEELDFGSNFTISLWAKTNHNFGLDSRSDPALVSNKNWGSGSNPGWAIATGENGRWQWNAGNGTNRCDYDGPAGQLNDGEWHHVVVAHELGVKAALFFDGEKVASKDCNIKSFVSGHPTRIGTDGVYYAWFTGDLDKVAFYGSALSHYNVKVLYDAGRKESFPSPTRAPTPPTEAPTDAPLNPTSSPTPSPSSSPTIHPTEHPSTTNPTSSPTPLPTACAYADPETCGCTQVQQDDYRGNISITTTGKTCQAWDQQSPHSHSRTAQNYPSSGLESNYCRNPDGEPRAWCYTTDPNSRWELCAVPDCGPPTE